MRRKPDPTPTPEIDYALLFPMAERWLELSEGEIPEIAEMARQAVQHVDEESHGEFSKWLTRRRGKGCRR